MDLKKLLKWVPAIIICSISVYLSSQPTIEKMPSFLYADKLVHLVCFAGLAFWVAFGFNLKKYSQFWISSIFVSVYGIIDEIHQSFTPGRSVSFFDWCCDSIGAVLGSLIFVFVCKILFNKK
jgi:VanZ family protein